MVAYIEETVTKKPNVATLPYSSSDKRKRKVHLFQLRRNNGTDMDL